MPDLLAPTKVLFVDLALSVPVRANLKQSLNAGTTSIELDLSDTENCVAALQDIRAATFQFHSIGIVADGEDFVSWSPTIMSKSFADAAAQILKSDEKTTTDASNPTVVTVIRPNVDLFACNMRANDLNVHSMSVNLGAGINVFFSTDRTGNLITADTQDWELEQCLRGGTLQVSTPSVERNVRKLYFSDNIENYAFSFGKTTNQRNKKGRVVRRVVRRDTKKSYMY